MLIQENIDQIFEESEVWERDPAAKAQGLDRVVLLIAQRRGEVRGLEPRLLDGVFAAWAVCLPFFPQPKSYTELMHARRAEWFENVSDEQRDQRAIRFFSDKLLQLDLNELAEIVASEDAVERVEGYLGVLADRDPDKEAEVGDRYEGAKVVKTTTFGAFVELVKGTDGLLHISNVKPGERVDSVEDVLSAGDEIDVTVVEVDKERGRIVLRLSDDPSVAGRSAEELAAGSGPGNGAEVPDAEERRRARRERLERRRERRQ